MAKQRSDLEIEIDDATRDWEGINRQENPLEWSAWISWRREYAGAHSEPEGLTVPTPFPPMTVQAAKDYLSVVKKIRVLVGWKSGTRRISNDPSAYRAAREAAE